MFSAGMAGAASHLQQIRQKNRPLAGEKAKSLWKMFSAGSARAASHIRQKKPPQLGAKTDRLVFQSNLV